jgi:hypothetical protein
MICYRIAGVSQLAAAQLAHPALARLRGRGPWTASEDGAGSVVLQRGQAQTWGEWRPGLGGLDYRLADPMPELRSAVAFRPNGSAAWADLPGAGRFPVVPATYAPVALGLGGEPLGPCDAYGQMALRIFDRMQVGDITLGDPDLVSFCRSALMSATDLTDELCHAFGLITTATVPLIWEAATGVGKPQADGG